MSASQTRSPGQSRAREAAASVRHPLSLTLLTLTFTTGLVDAVSYLGLGHVFTANMTGNVVLLGFGIAGGAHLPVLAPLISMAAFLIGAAVGGGLALRVEHRHAAHIGVVLGIEAALLVCAAIVTAVAAIRPGVSADTVIALMALAMGVRNATVRRLAVPDLTTTVLTMTLTGLAAELGSASGRAAAPRRVSAVMALLCGALTGAVLLKAGLVWPLGLAAALAATSGVTYSYRAESSPGAQADTSQPK